MALLWGWVLLRAAFHMCMHCPLLQAGHCPMSITEPQSIFQSKQAPWEKPRRSLYKPGDTSKGGDGQNHQYFSTSLPKQPFQE